MSKKDYIAIAEIIRHSITFNQLIAELANYCKEENHLFDKVKFIQACGLDRMGLPEFK